MSNIYMLDVSKGMCGIKTDGTIVPSVSTKSMLCPEVSFTYYCKLWHTDIMKQEKPAKECLIYSTNEVHNTQYDAMLDCIKQVPKDSKFIECNYWRNEPIPDGYDIQHRLRMNDKFILRHWHGEPIENIRDAWIHEGVMTIDEINNIAFMTDYNVMVTKLLDSNNNRIVFIDKRVFQQR